MPIRLEPTTPPEDLRPDDPTGLLATEQEEIDLQEGRVLNRAGRVIRSLFTADFDRRRVAYRDAGAGTTWSPEILLTNSAALPAMSSIAGNSRIETIGDRRFLWVYTLSIPGSSNRSVDVTIP